MTAQINFVFPALGATVQSAPLGPLAGISSVSLSQVKAAVAEKISGSRNFSSLAVYLTENGKLLREQIFGVQELDGRVFNVECKLRGGIQISIKTLSGRQQQFTFEPNCKVREVKQALQEKEGIQVEQIRLIYSGKQLNDDKDLEFYKVQPGAVLHMVLSLRGGRA